MTKSPPRERVLDAPAPRPKAGDNPVCVEDVGRRIYALIEELYPICRSITGDGLRETLAIVGAQMPLDVHEVPTGTPVLDWRVPKEWNIREAFIRGPKGDKVVDFADSNLHVVNYSVPVRAKMPLAALKEHLFTHPGRPDWIPYRSSLFTETWGFCLSENQLQGLEDGEYEVVIDSTLADGALTYGESYFAGETDEEILLFTHICHPSLCNDNLSGIALLAELGRYLSTRPRRYSYRLVFAPTTIGSITWLGRNESRLSRIHAGLVIAMVGDRGKLTYKSSRRGNTSIDRAARTALGQSGRDFDTIPFSPSGNDERQFCSPGFNLPVGRLTRATDGSYPEYHTSADDLRLVDARSLAESFDACVDILDVLERDRKYINNVQRGEPQLSRRGIHQRFGGIDFEASIDLARLWVLNYSDGEHALLDIAELGGLDFHVVAEAAATLHEAGVLDVLPERAARGAGTR